MIEQEYTYKTVDGESVTVTFDNTMRAVMTRRWLNLTHAAGELDENLREAFCWITSHTGWGGVKYGCSSDEFVAAYLAFGETVDSDTFWDIANKIVAMSQRADEIEKPDSALTEDDKNNPN